MKSLTFIQKLLMIMLFVGVADAAPTTAEDRLKYTQTLNPTISTLMSWYGSKIADTKKPVSLRQVGKNLGSHLPEYPNKITQINILKTDIINLKAKKNNQLMVTSLLTYKEANTLRSKRISEVFSLEKLSPNKVLIKSITRNNEEVVETKNVETKNTQKFDRFYFKAREFSYAWLAYLDGVDTRIIIDQNQWLTDANYALKIGAESVQGSVSQMLEKRRESLFKGGHLLREISVKKSAEKPNFYSLDLIIEWKGDNKSGNPVLAKIHQVITFEVLKDSSWKIISIQEEHLLPDIAPWQGLLC